MPKKRLSHWLHKDKVVKEKKTKSIVYVTSQLAWDWIIPGNSKSKRILNQVHLTMFLFGVIHFMSCTLYYLQPITHFHFSVVLCPFHFLFSFFFHSVSSKFCGNFQFSVLFCFVVVIDMRSFLLLIMYIFSSLWIPSYIQIKWCAINSKWIYRFIRYTIPNELNQQ